MKEWHESTVFHMLSCLKKPCMLDVIVTFIYWLSEAQKEKMSCSLLEPISRRTRPRTGVLDLRSFVLPSTFLPSHNRDKGWWMKLNELPPWGPKVSLHLTVIASLLWIFLLGREVAGETLGEQDVRAVCRPGDLPLHTNALLTTSPMDRGTEAGWIEKRSGWE